MTQKAFHLYIEPKWWLIDRVLRDRPGGHTSYRNAFWSKKDRRRQRREAKKITAEAERDYYYEWESLFTLQHDDCELLDY